MVLILLPVLLIFFIKIDSERTKNDFDLTFDRSVQGYAENTFHQDLTEFTISFWTKVSSEELESGTVMSYAYENDGMTIVFFYLYTKS